MKQYDVVAKTEIGELLATFRAEDDLPSSLLLGVVMTHNQVLPHARRMSLDRANTLLIATPSRLQMEKGFTIVFPDGVRLVGPTTEPRLTGLPPQYEGRTLVHDLRIAAIYRVEPQSDVDDEHDDTTAEFAPVGHNGLFSVN